MLCEKCGQREATTHVRQNINGHIQEFHLCTDCATLGGKSELIGSFSHTFSDMLSALFGEPRSIPSQKRCEGCGALFSDIVSSGKLGCAKCYSTFYQELLPTISRLHGQTEHIGKVSGNASEEVKTRRRLQSLRQQLQQAIEEEEFEKAAALRDNIRQLEKEGEENV